MKNNAIGMFLALAAACLGSSALDAQTTTDFSARVPFAFQVGGQSLPAGKYVVHENGQQRLPSIQNAVTGQSILVTGAANVLSQVGPGRLVFHCYAGATCFLAEIRPGSVPGSRASVTKAEKELASGGRREIATISIDLQRAD